MSCMLTCVNGFLNYKYADSMEDFYSKQAFSKNDHQKRDVIIIYFNSQLYLFLIKFIFSPT